MFANLKLTFQKRFPKANKELLKKFLFSSVIPTIIAIVILCTSGYAYSTKLGRSDTALAISLLCLLLFLVVLMVVTTKVDTIEKLRHPFKNLKQLFSVTLIICVLFLVSFIVLTIVNLPNNDISTILHYFVLVIIGLCFCKVIPFKTFAKYFSNALVILSVISLVLFASFLVSGSSFVTDVFYNSIGTTYYSFFGVFFTLNHALYRNSGPFWEPGLFSTFLVLGLLFEILFKEKLNKVKIIILALTIVTTFSTAGILLALLMIPLAFAVKKKKKPFWISLSITIALFGIVVFLSLLPIEIPFISDVLLKFNITNGSFMTRIQSIIYDFQFFSQSYSLGYGPNRFDELYLEAIKDNVYCNSQTSTVGWLCGAFGFAGYFILLEFFIFMFLIIKSKRGIIPAIFVSLIAFLIMNKEPQYSFSIFWIFMFYPFFEDSRAAKKGFTLWDKYKAASDNSKKTVTSLTGSILIKGLALFVALFTFPLYIAFFSNDAILGVWSTLLSILSWVLMFDIGIGNGLKNKVIECIAKKDEVMMKKYISSAYFTNLLISAGLLVVGLIVIFNLDFNALLNISTETISLINLQIAFAIAFFSICLEFFLKLILNLLQAMQKQPLASIISLCSSILLLLFTMVIRFASATDALIAISIFYIFSVNVPLLIVSIVLFATKFKTVRPNFKFLDKGAAKTVMSLGGFFFVIQLCLLFINSTNQLLISNAFGAEVVVDYQRYYKIFAAITAVASAISVPVWALAVKAYTENDKAWLIKIQKLLFALAIVFAVGIVIVTIGLQVILNLWLGSNSVTVNYFTAAMFALWALSTTISYFATGISNGLKILLPQLICFLIFGVLKIPLFYLLRWWINIDWSYLVLIDAVILGISGIIFAVLNYIKIKKMQVVKDIEKVEADHEKI